MREFGSRRLYDGGGSLNTLFEVCLGSLNANRAHNCDDKRRRKGVLRDHLLSKERSNSRGASRLYRLQHAD
jgi:hypothetical protein